MKNGKKKFALVLSLVMAVSMAMTACSLSDDDDDDDDDDSSSKKSIFVSSDKDEDSSSDDDDESSDAAGEDDESSSEETTTTTTKAPEPEPEPEPTENTTTTTQAALPEPDETVTTTKKSISNVAVSGNYEPEEQPVVDFFKALEENNKQKFDAVFPQGLLDVFSKALADEKGFFDYFREELSEEYGESFTIGIKIAEKEKMTPEETEQLNEELKNNFNLDTKIDEAYSIGCDATINGNGKSDDDTLYVYVGKVDGDWKLLNLF